MAGAKKQQARSGGVNADVSAELTAAKQALAKSDHEAACAALLAAWRGTRDPGIGVTLSEISAQFAAVQPKIEGKTKELLPKWLALEETGSCAGLGFLLQTLSAGNSKESGERLLALEKRSPDPRIAETLTAFIEKPPYTGSSTGPFFTKIFEALQSNADPRSVPRLRAATFGMNSHGAQRERLIERIPVISDAIEAELRTLCRALSPAERALLDTISVGAAPIEKPKSAQSREALYAAVWAAPDDDAPRAVLADFLQQQDDPHGRFIALQLATQGRKPTKEENAELKALEKDYWRRFLGPLDGFVKKDGLAFARGFPSRGVASEGQANSWTKEIEEHPAWSTFDAIGDPESLNMVRHAREVTGALDLVLTASEELRVERLALSVGSIKDGALAPAIVERLKACRSLPALRHLKIWADFDGNLQPERIGLREAFSFLFELELGRNLSGFATRTPGGVDPASWIAAVASRPGELAELRLSEGWGSLYDFAMPEIGFTLVYALKTRALKVLRSKAQPDRKNVPNGTFMHPLPDPDWLVPVLEAIDPAHVSSVVVEPFFGQRPQKFGPTGPPPASTEEKARVKAALAKFAHHELRD